MIAGEASARGLFPGRGFPAGDHPVSIAVTDLDGDGISDLATADELSDVVAVLLGNGDGTFQAAAFFPAGVGPVSIAAADLDGDTFPDLVTGHFFFLPTQSTVNVLRGNGDGTFQGCHLLPGVRIPGVGHCGRPRW